ncbi:hypothetical protein JCM19294_1005 [Nonlabens tegetincola]|uniref:Abortive infection protein-like C-terminal domain-containing protein n=1 Tax=Nonlabens tegetincola TaxID=323273 RepID=A0A090QMD0_9FLAO|nr:hypothetical protein [Nonlabens tegetincola]GAK96696.1 hypothetical protein JCM19294_1005 [Nonlabens tegetincola]
MELTKAKIEEFKDDIEGLTGYSLIVKEIEENLPKNPDISIESCKSLIEGLCKKSLELISDKYNDDIQVRRNCEGKMTYLVRMAFDEVYRTGFERDLHMSLYKIIKNKDRIDSLIASATSEMQKNAKKAVDKITAIRHDRGDISHGRIYPKPTESELHLANSIQSITDGICSFMIHELAIQYEIKKEEDKKLVYKKEEEYNEWLDDQNDNLITKIDFSRLLFDNSYEKYEEIYYAEYQDHLLTLEGEDAEDSADTQPVVEAVQKEIISLVNTFDEKTFWTEERLEKLKAYALSQDLYEDKLKSFIEDYYFSGIEPRRDKVYEVMKYPPSLADRRTVLLVVTEFAIEFAEELKNS